MNCRSCNKPTHPQGAGKRSDAHIGRGLCSPCHGRHDRAGTLDQYPRATWPRDELMAEWDHLRRSGVCLRDAHARIGMSAAAFERAYQRARAGGDPRAIAGPWDRPRRLNLAEAPTTRRALQQAFGDEAGAA